LRYENILGVYGMPAFIAASSLRSRPALETIVQQSAINQRRDGADFRQSLRANCQGARAVAGFIALATGCFAPSLQTRASCDAAGNIAGANASIVLGASGCATASSSASVAPTASVANGISGSNASWTIINAGSLGGGTTLFAGGSLTNVAGGSITSGNGAVLIRGGARVVNNAGTIAAGVGPNGFQ
jgi:hypothetical protein